MEDENGDPIANFHNILNRWKNYVSQILNAHGVSDVRKIEIHTAEPLVPVPNPCDVEITIAELKGLNRQVVIKFRQNRFKQEVKH
jgi:hypothetical protein